MNKILQSIKTFWYSLPKPVQTALMLFLGAATGVIRHALSNPNACMTASCWKGYLASAVHAGVLAVMALYVRPGPGPLGARVDSSATQ